MKKRIILSTITLTFLMLIIVSCGQNNSNDNNGQPQGSNQEIDSGKSLEKVEELNSFVKENKLKAEFGIDPNDSSTLCFYRVSTMSAENIDFKNSIFGYGTSIEDLKKAGFNKVRVYSSKDSYKKYALILL